MQFLFTLAFGASVYYLGYLHGNSIVEEPVAQECEQKQQVIIKEVIVEKWHVQEKEVIVEIEREEPEYQEERYEVEEVDQEEENQKATDEALHHQELINQLNDLPNETCIEVMTDISEDIGVLMKSADSWLGHKSNKNPTIFYYSHITNFQIVDCNDF